MSRATRLNSGVRQADATATFVGQPTPTAPVGSPYWMANGIQDLAFSSGPGDRKTVISPSLAGEGTVVQEPSLWVANGLFHMIYTGGSGSPALFYASCPTTADPAVAANWTKASTPVLGQGNGGESGGAYHSNVYVEGSTGYMFYAVAPADTVLAVATFNVNTPTVVTKTATTYALPSGGTLWGNTSLLKEADGTYTLMFECSTSAYSWQTGVGTLGTSPTGPLTVTQFPVTSLRPSDVNANATVSGPNLFLDGSTYVLYYHAGRSGSLPTDLYRATSTDKLNWTIDNNARPILHRAAPVEVDQVADSFLLQSPDGQCYLFYTAYDNTAPRAYVMCAPAIPTLKRRSGDRWEKLTPTDTTPRISDPGKIVAATVTTDYTSGNTGAFADITGLTNVSFTPRGTRALVRLMGAFSNTASTTANRFQVTDGGSITKGLSSVTPINAGAQTAVAGAALLTGLTPGQRYTFKAQVKPSSGTVQVRAATLPDQEQLTLVIEDVKFP